MKLDIIPYSDEWFELKKVTIGATEASIINGTNKFNGNSPIKLLKLKLGLIEREEANEVMELGMQMEADARRWFEEKYKCKAKECVYRHDKYKYLIATLDGDIDKDSYSEFKCGAIAYSAALQGKIGQYYIDQIQHTFYVTNKKKCYLVFFQMGNEPVVKEILRDDEYINELMKKEHEFYKTWQETMVSKMEWDEKMKAIKENDEMIKNLTKVNDEYKEELYAQFEERNVIFKELGIIIQYQPAGKLTDWSKVCEEYNISKDDLEKFTKERKRFYKMVKI